MAVFTFCADHVAVALVINGPRCATFCAATIWVTFLAISKPIAVICMLTAPCCHSVTTTRYRSSLSGAAPSTTSIANICEIRYEPSDRPIREDGMSFLLDGKPTDDVCSLRLTPTRPVVEMVLLEPEEAVRRFAASMRWVLSIVGVILVGGAIALGVAVPPVDRVLVIPLSVVGLGAVAALTPYMYRLQIRRYREQLATMRYPGPPGTTLRCDDRGLTIASRLIPWSALSIETAYLLNVKKLYQAHYQLVATHKSLPCLWLGHINLAGPRSSPGGGRMCRCRFPKCGRLSQRGRSRGTCRPG